MDGGGWIAKEESRVKLRIRLELIKEGLYKGRERYWVIQYWVENR